MILPWSPLLRIEVAAWAAFGLPQTRWRRAVEGKGLHIPEWCSACLCSAVIWSRLHCRTRSPVTEISQRADSWQQTMLWRIDEAKPGPRALAQVVRNEDEKQEVWRSIG